MKIAELFVVIGAKLDNFNRGMADVDKAMKRLGDKLTRTGKMLTLGVTLPLAAVGGAAVKMAMDAVESENLFEVTFGKMAKTVRTWSRDVSKALGMNQYEVRKTVGIFFDMVKSMGLTEKQAAEMAEQMTMLGYDIASFRNLKPEEAFEKLRSAIVGMPRPMQDLGYVINETTIKSWALANGLIKQGEELTTAQKVWARYKVMMEITKTAQGDLARTMDSPANKLRILKSRVEELSIDIGMKLLPAFEKVLKVIDKGVQWVSNLSDGTKTLIVKFFGLAAIVGPATIALGQFLKTVSALNTIGKIGNVIKLAGAIGILAIAFYTLKKAIDANREANRQLQQHYDDQFMATQKVMQGTLDLAAVDADLAKKLDKLREKYKGNNEALIDAILSGKEGAEIQKQFSEALNKATIQLEKQEKELKKGKEGAENFNSEFDKTAQKIIVTAEVIETKLYPGMRKLGPVTYDVMVKVMTYIKGVKEEIINLSRIIPEKLEPTILKVSDVLKYAQEKLKSHTLYITDKVKTAWQRVSEEIMTAWVRGLSEIVVESKNATEAIINIFKSMARILIDVVLKALVEEFLVKLKIIKESAKTTALSMKAGFVAFAAYVTYKLIPHVLNAFSALWSAIAGGAENTGDIISKEMLRGFSGATEKKTRGGEELMERMLEHLNKIPAALLTLIKNAGKFGEGLKNLGKIGKLTFNALIANGMTFLEALKALKEPLETLIRKFEKAGRDIPQFLRPLADMLEKMKLHPKVFENLDAAMTILNSLKETAYLTQDAFLSLAVYAKRFARTLLDGMVGNLNKAMKTLDLTGSQIQALLPIVSQFVSAASQFNIPVPKWMKTFVERQLGVDWKEFKKSVTDPAVQSNKWLEKIYNKTQRSIDILKIIAKRVRGLENIRFGQHGISETAYKPSLYVAGERGPEDVSIRPTTAPAMPNISIGSTPVSIYLDSRKVGMATIQHFPQFSKAGHMKIHSRAIQDF